MSVVPIERGRRGGRAARQALRAVPQPAAERPVRPGLEGGRYRVLDDHEIRRIHEAALDVLERVGFADPIPSCVEAVTAIGGAINGDGRLVFPRALVEDAVAKAARRFPVCGRDPKHDMEPWGKRVYFGTGGAAVSIVDARTGAYRDSTLADLYDIARLADTLEHVHFYQRSIVCRDMESPRELDINTAYACLAGTTKHFGSSFALPEHVDECLAMLHEVAGGEAAWRARPFMSYASCFVVPPLRFAVETCQCLEAAVRGGMPVLLLSAGQAGATAPASIAGTVVQAVAEVLAGLVYVNAIRPGAPAIFGTWPFVSDLRSGAMSGGSGEQAIMIAACAQMAQFYDLVGGMPSGMTDSKVPDAQAGYEKSYNHALVGNAGANMVYESAGMLASLLGFSLETMVIDNDIIGATLRTQRGIEITDEALSTEVIRSVCIEGPGHYLGHDQTLALMQSDYLYPEVGDRTSPKEWVEQGSTDVIERASRRVRETLAAHYPSYIPDDVDARIRERLPIRLPREAMRPPQAATA